jgi:hypothetical protein
VTTSFRREAWVATGVSSRVRTIEPRTTWVPACWMRAEYWRAGETSVALLAGEVERTTGPPGTTWKGSLVMGS